MGPEGSWDNWGRHVLKELERLNTNLTHIQEHQIETRLEITTLKARASVWGFVAGMVPGVVLGIIELLK